ncbi:MAG: FecR domain-containing protein [Spirochaetales bacterium]|nr:FecR domain-containing protein [Spirochaetales bacterium]
MKRPVLVLSVAALAIAALALSATAPAVAPFGEIDYVEGSVTVTRAGKAMTDPNFGDPIRPDDLVKTGPDGTLIIAMDKTTGMRGTITVKPRSAVYIRLDPKAGSQKTTLELMAGQIASKVTKLAGAPSMKVQTAVATAGVRGTEYGVLSSVNGSISVFCLEGAVFVEDETGELDVPAGRAAERKAGQRLKVLPVAVSSGEDFARRWISDEIEVFKGGALKFLDDYATRYDDLKKRFDTAFEPIQRSAALKKWMDEDRAGTLVNPRSPSTLREKKEVDGPILEARKVLFMFERIYYRLDEIDAIVRGTSLERELIRPGLTVGEFLRRIRDERDALGKRVALYRYAEKLYNMRSETNPFGDSGGSFFGDSGSFFGKP